MDRTPRDWGASKTGPSKRIFVGALACFALSACGASTPALREPSTPAVETVAASTPAPETSDPEPDVQADPSPEVAPIADTRRDVHIEGMDRWSWCTTRALRAVEFPHEQASVTPQQVEQLERLLVAVDGMCMPPDATFCLRGHADRSERAPEFLARSRGEAIREWLNRRGIAIERIRATGHGVADPVSPRVAPDRGANRRVEVLTSDDCPTE